MKLLHLGQAGRISDGLLQRRRAETAVGRGGQGSGGHDSELHSPNHAGVAREPPKGHRSLRFETGEHFVYDDVANAFENRGFWDCRLVPARSPAGEDRGWYFEIHGARSAQRRNQPG